MNVVILLVWRRTRSIDTVDLSLEKNSFFLFHKVVNDHFALKIVKASIVWF